MLRIIAVLAAVTVLPGCAVIAPAVLTTGLTMGAQAFKLDDDIFNWWAAHRGVKVTPAAPVCTPAVQPSK